MHLSRRGDLDETNVPPMLNSIKRMDGDGREDQARRDLDLDLDSHGWPDPSMTMEKIE